GGSVGHRRRHAEAEGSHADSEDDACPRGQGDRLACRETRKGGTSTVRMSIVATTQPTAFAWPVRAAARVTGVPGAAVERLPPAVFTVSPDGAPESGSTAPGSDPEPGVPVVLPGVPDELLVPPFDVVPDEVLVLPLLLVVPPVVLETVHDEPSFMHLLGIGAECRMLRAGLLHLLIDGDGTAPGMRF